MGKGHQESIKALLITTLNNGRLWKPFITGAGDESAVDIWESYDEAEVVALGELRLTKMPV
jgi:hypothetical protein